MKFANGGLTCKIESTTTGIIMVHEVQTVGSSGSHTIFGQYPFIYEFSPEPVMTLDGSTENTADNV